MYEVINSTWSQRSEPVGAWGQLATNGASGFQTEYNEKQMQVPLAKIEDLKRSYASLILQLDRLRPKLAAADALSLSAEGGWSVKEILGHIIDTDREVWWPRINAILERKNWCSLPIEDIFAQLMRTRWEFAMKLQELAAPDFEKIGEYPALGEVSIFRILQFLVENDARYLENIRSLVDGKSDNAFAS